MGKVLFTQLARKSILEVSRYVAKKSQSLEVALSLVDSIENRCNQYAEFPNMGRDQSFLPSGVKVFNVHSYVVVYQPREEGIVVLFVANSSRDIPTVYRDLFG